MTADTVDPRYGAPIWGTSAPHWPGVNGWNDILALFTGKSAIANHGNTASRPAATVRDQVYFDTQTNRLWYSDGTTWVEVSPVGGSGAPPGSPAFGQAAVEGTSRVAMRKDAKPSLPAWPVTGFTTHTGSSGLLGVNIGNHAVFDFALTSGQAPAGEYLLVLNTCHGTQSRASDAFTTGTWSFNVNSVQLGNTWPADCDRKQMMGGMTWRYAHAGGSLEFQLYLNPVSAIVDVDKYNTKLTVEYLGG